MSQSKETNAGQVEPKQHLQTSLIGIESKARRFTDYKFKNLSNMLNQMNLIESWSKVNKRAARGVDKVSAKEFEANLFEEVAILEKELKADAYKARLIRRTYIEKPNGDKRPLGIPVVRDKLLQALCSSILEAIYEPKFYDFRFGYRRDKGAKGAVKHLREQLTFGKYGYVVEADIKGYFQNINHEKLLKMLEHDIADKRFIRLISKWLKAGTLTEENIVEKPHKGTQQGGVISPILANVYLHYILDMWFEKKVKREVEGECMMVAYADDFVCAFRYRRDAVRFMESLEARFKVFGLELAKDKTKMIKFSRFSKDRNEDFDFLGFTFRWKESKKGKDYVTHTSAKKKFRQAVKRMKEWLMKNRHRRLENIINQINSKLRGYYNYYGIRGNSKMLWEMDELINRLLYKWLNKRSQRRSFTWKAYNRMITKKYVLIKPFMESRHEQIVMTFC